MTEDTIRTNMINGLYDTISCAAATAYSQRSVVPVDNIISCSPAAAAAYCLSYQIFPEITTKYLPENISQYMPHNVTQYIAEPLREYLPNTISKFVPEKLYGITQTANNYLPRIVLSGIDLSFSMGTEYFARMAVPVWAARRYDDGFTTAHVAKIWKATMKFSLAKEVMQGVIAAVKNHLYAVPENSASMLETDTRNPDKYQATNSSDHLAG